MKAIAKIDNLNSTESKRRIIRNLSRILDLRILNIDMESKTVHFVYDSIFAFEKAKRELFSIGCPISKCSYQNPYGLSKRRNDKFQVVAF